MSLPHALLGLLAARPSSGFEMTKAFERSLAHAWSAHHSQIYPTLAQLRGDGFIRQRETGPRGRKIYEITDAGLAEMRRWLTETEPERRNRNQAVLRVFFLWLLTPEQAQAYVRREAEYHRRQLALFEEISRGGDFVTPSSPLALEWGLRYEAAIGKWFDWARQQLELKGTGEATKRRPARKRASS